MTSWTCTCIRNLKGSMQINSIIFLIILQTIYQKFVIPILAMLWWFGKISFDQACSDNRTRLRFIIYMILLVWQSQAFATKILWTWSFTAKNILIPTWFEHATFWSGVRRATVAPRDRWNTLMYNWILICLLYIEILPAIHVTVSLSKW